MKPRKSLKLFHIITQEKFIHHHSQLILFLHVLQRLVFNEHSIMIIVSPYSTVVCCTSHVFLRSAMLH